MSPNSLLYWLLYFAVTVLVAWIALSLILIWARPALYNADGSINWWTTLWVSALVVLLAWLILIIVRWLLSVFNNNACNPCADHQGEAVWGMY